MTDEEIDRFALVLKECERTRQGRFTRVRGETVWKLLRTGQPPHHEPRHRRVDEGLPGGAQPLVVLGHPLVMEIHAKVRSTTQRLGRTRKPLGGMSLCQSTSLPSLAHSAAQPAQRSATFSGSAFGACAPPLRSSPSPPRPTLCPSPGSRIDPQMRKAREASAHRLQQQPYAILVGHPGAVYPCF